MAARLKRLPLDATTPVRLSVPTPPAYDVRAAKTLGLTKAKSPISRAGRTATTPARQSGRKTRRQRGNLAKSLRRQIGKSYDSKEVRNMDA